MAHHPNGLLLAHFVLNGKTNFGELRKAEVRRTLLLGTSVNKLMRKSAGRA